MNVCALFLLTVGLLGLFAGYPIISHYTIKHVNGDKSGFNIGGTNGSGQVPANIGNLAQLIDTATPVSAQTWRSPIDKSTYHIVFSDEFEEEGRTFWPGDDPYWEAVDIWYGATGDFEWYSPEAINTTGGALVITMTEKVTHNLNFQSGMLQSWNKFCFQGGVIEMAAILPGGSNTPGFWPGLWTMGNLARPGYLGSTDGMWPYSYDSCDTGILANQTYVNKTGPYGALNANGQYSYQVNGDLSWLSGMRAPACTCSGEDHPGPNNNVGRAAPELDLLEAQIGRYGGEASQSMQLAPFDPDYLWDQTKATIYDSSNTVYNVYVGGVYQECASGLSQIPNYAYDLSANSRFVKFAVEYDPDWTGDGSGSITWYIDGTAMWTLSGDALPARKSLDISQRLIPVEPMSIVMNLGISNGFQRVQWSSLTFPARLQVDYVRVYQKDGQADRIGCDPPDHPTSQYIQDHLDVYTNPNYTMYPRDKYGWPKNKLTGC